MTLVIVLACKDGIVMASDGQVTTISSGGPIRQMGAKIKQIGQSTLWSGSGEVGFIQKVEKAIERFPFELKNAGIDEIKSQIIRVIHKIRKDALDLHTGLHGSEKGASSADLLFADCKDGIPKILHVNADVKDTELQEFGYGATGIGDTFAYTILMNYYVNIFSVDLGKVLAYRVIKDAMEVGAFGLGEPIDIWTITQVKEKDKKIVKACRVEKEEMEAIRDTCNSWKAVEAEIFETIVKPKK